MATLDLADDTFVVADARQVAARVADRDAWRRWWPDLELRVSLDRGLAGVRWTVSGALVGWMEIWLEPVGDGVLVHHYLRAEHPDPRSDRAAERDRRRRARSWKGHVHALKDELEAGRVPGTPRTREGVKALRPPAEG